MTVDTNIIKILDPDGAIRERIAQDAATMLLDEAEVRAVKLFQETVESYIKDIVNATADKMLKEIIDSSVSGSLHNVEISSVSEFGRPAKRLNLAEYAKSQVDNIINQKVDGSGEPWRYSSTGIAMTRLEFMIKRSVDNAIKSEIEEGIRLAKSLFTNAVSEASKNALSRIIDDAAAK